MKALLALLLLFGKPAVDKVISVPCDSSQPQTVTVTLPPARLQQPYKVTFQATSGVAPFRFLWISGTLPFGLTWDNGVISGVPQSKVTTQFTLECHDSQIQ